MKRISKKGLLLGMGIIVSLLITLGLAFYSFKYVQKNLKTLLFASGASLSRTVIESSRTVFMMQSESETDLNSQLYMDIGDVEDITEETVNSLSGYPLVIMTDTDGNVIHKVHLSNNEAFLLLKNFRELVLPLYDDGFRDYIFGIDPDFPGRQIPKGMGIRRGDRVLIVFAETGGKQIEGRGLGFLIRDIAQEPGIGYIVLQNPDGVMLASRGVNRISGFQSDSFLRSVYENNQARGKFREFQGHKIYEVITPFPKMGEFYGVLRIGLSLQEYNAVLTAITIPLIIVFFLLCLMTVLFINSKYMQKRLMRAESFREGITTIEHLVYVEFNGHGLVQRSNQTAVNLLDVEEDRTNMESIIGEENLTTLMTRGKLVLTGLHRNGRVYNLTAQRIISATDKGEERFYVLAEDVTELFDLKRRAEGLHHLEGLAELTSTIAHDIRNPLNAVSMAVQKLDMRMERTDDEKGQALLKTINNEIANLNKMVEDFLALSAPVSIRKSRVRTSEFLDEIYQNALMHASQSGVGIKLENLIIENNMDVDSGRLKRALGNIVKNGIEAADRGTDLVIEAQILEGNLVMTIENKGKTIPPEVLPNLFRPVASGKSGGYGLGLFSAYRIVRTHRGDIEVTSDKGRTVFTVTIPVE